MVVFTCTHCGESLQKPRVEKHYNTVCRNKVSVSCMDCFKDFRGEEYIQHTKCITEAERYSGRDFKPKPSANKGLLKQEKWIESIQNILSENPKIAKNQRDILNVVSRHENVPRKLNKFQNFMKNINSRIQVQDINAVFQLLDNEHRKNAAITEPTTNGNKINGTDPSKLETNCQKNGTETIHNEKFRWKPTILHFVNKKQKISSKKLMKKVLNAYRTYNPELCEVSDDIIKRYHTKLSKMKKIIVETDFVKLKQ